MLETEATRKMCHKTLSVNDEGKLVGALCVGRHCVAWTVDVQRTEKGDARIVSEDRSQGNCGLKRMT